MIAAAEFTDLAPDTQDETETCLPMGEVIAFIRKHGRNRVFANWTDEQVNGWLTYYSAHGSCIIMCNRRHVIRGVLVGWRGMEGRGLEEPWVPSDPQGDAFYVAQIVAPGRTGLRMVIAEWFRQNPDWQHLRFIVRRKGRLVHVPLRQLERLLRFARVTPFV